MTPAKKEGGQYHIRCAPGELPPYVLLPGDPARVSLIGEGWDRYEQVSEHREYRCGKGVYKGVEMAVCSTGIGAPSTSIAIEELARLGCHTFIRVGSTGALQREIGCGDLVVNTGSVRMDGASERYVLKGYPAVASYEVTLALIEACERVKTRYHVGIAASTDSFYLGQGRPGYGGYWQSRVDHLLEDLQQARVTNFEMEAAAVFVLANLFDLRAGCVCAVFANRVTDAFEEKGEREACTAASEALRILAEWDAAKGKKGKRYYYPSL